MVDNENLQREVWDSDRVDEVREQIQMGYKPRSHPFWNGKPSWRGENITFSYTDHELQEKLYCKRNIIHFANNYAKVMTDKGRKIITLRDYQEELLLKYDKYQSNVVLSSRQSGKCGLFSTLIDIKNHKTNVIETICIGDLFYRELSKLRKLTFKEKITWKLWRLYSFVEKLSINKQKNN